MKKGSFKQLRFRTAKISNFQETLTVKAKSWGYSCFTSLKDNF